MSIDIPLKSAHRELYSIFKELVNDLEPNDVFVRENKEGTVEFGVNMQAHVAHIVKLTLTHAFNKAYPTPPGTQKVNHALQEMRFVFNGSLEEFTQNTPWKTIKHEWTKELAEMNAQGVNFYRG